MGAGLPGQEPVVQPDRLRRGPRAVHRQAGRLRRLRLGIEGRPGQAGHRPLRWQPGVEPAAGVRPGGDGLQPRGRRQARRQRRPARQDLPGPDHEVERPGRRRAELRRDAARHRHQADLPVGLVGHHRQLPEVPGGRRPAELDQGFGQRVPGRRRRGRAEVGRCRPGRPGHPRCNRLRGEGLRCSRPVCRSLRSTAAQARSS